MPSHTVKQGECLSGIARQHGFSVDTLWNHPDNKALRDKRKSPNVLHVGDVIAIPDKEQKQLKVTSNQTHQFQVKVKPPELRLRVLAGGKPVKGAAYTLHVDGAEPEPKKARKTDGDGMVIAPVGHAAGAASVSVQAQNTVYEVKLGHLDPVTEATGARARLRQLGYFPGPVGGGADALFQVAVWLFQNNHGLPTTGALDDATREELEKAYGI